MSNIFNPESGINAAHQAPMVDISKPGQQIIRDFKNIQYSPRYIQQRAIVALVRMPRLLGYLPGGDLNKHILKSLIETRYISVTGIDNTLSAEFHNEVEGGAAKRDTLNMTAYADSTLAFTWPSVSGRTIERFLESYILNLGMDPETGYARIASSENYLKDADENPALQLDSMEARTFAILVYEPNANMNGVVNACLYENCFFKGAGTNTMSSTVQEALQAPNVEVELTNIPIRARAVYKMAEEHIRSLSRPGLNSENAKLHISGISGEVLASNSGVASVLKSNTPVS